MSHGYKFYIQQVQKVGNEYIPIESTTIDLESYYAGLKYSKLTGTNDKGKAKNIYTEKYADGDRLRVYIPKLVKNEATTMTLTLYFFGENRQQVFSEFAKEIKTGIHRYWDTARQQYFDFFVDDELKPSDENWYKGEPYFKVDVKMKNLYGETFNRIGVNLLVDGEKTIESNTYILGEYNLGNVRPMNGDLVRLSFSGYISVDNHTATPPRKGYDKFRVFNSDGYIPLCNTIDMSNYDSSKKRFVVEFPWVYKNDKYEAANDKILFYQAQSDNTPLTDEELPEGYVKGMSMIYDVKLEFIK